MNFKFLAIALLLTIALAGCFEESLPEQRESVLGLAKTNSDFNSFLEEYPFAEIITQPIEEETSGIFEKSPIIERAEKECGIILPDKAYWHVKAKSPQREIEAIIDRDIREIKCVIKKSRCGQDIDCNDQKQCTLDKCNLTTEECEFEEITECKSADGCCPEGCTYSTDYDCGSERKECRSDADCNDGNPCTVNICNKSAGKCTVSQITECKSGDICCPTACSTLNDSDCSSIIPLKTCSNEGYSTAVRGEGSQAYVSLSDESISKLSNEISLKGDSALGGIADLDCLEFLDLQNMNIEDISPLEDLKNLKTLGLNNNNSSDLSPIYGLTNLETLNAGRNPFSDISGLGNLKKLTILDLENTDVSDVTALKGLPELVVLNLRYTKVPAQECESLKSQILTLEALYCPGSEPTDACQTDYDCDDNDICTKDLCLGKPKICTNSRITSCTHGDSCCPSGCTSENDSDCKAIGCFITYSDGICLKTCTKDTDADCCMSNYGCWIYQSGKYQCFPNLSANPSNSNYICDVSSSKTSWTELLKPDLAIIKVDFAPREILVGQPAQMIVYYSNTGIGKAENFYIGNTHTDCGAEISPKKST